MIFFLFRNLTHTYRLGFCAKRVYLRYLLFLVWFESITTILLDFVHSYDMPNLLAAFISTPFRYQGRL